MDTELEQVSRCLEEALTAFSAGQSDDGCRYLQEATAILDTIAAPPEMMTAAEAMQATQPSENELPTTMDDVQLRAMAVAA